MAITGWHRLALAATVGLLNACATPTGPQPPTPAAAAGSGAMDWAGFVDTFLAAVRARDLKTLNRVRGRGRTYDRMSMVDRRFYALLYDGNYVRAYRRGGRSAMELLALGAMHAHVVDEGAGRVLIYFVPHAFLDDLDDHSFIHTQWMRKYFSCLFARRGGEWGLADDCNAAHIRVRTVRRN